MSLNPGSFRSHQKILQNHLQTNKMICKVQQNNKVFCLLSNQRQCILLKDGRQWLLREGSFFSKYKYHHTFCWLGDQSVSNNILRFSNFYYQHWNQDMSLISRLYQICVHSEKRYFYKPKEIQRWKIMCTYTVEVPMTY